MDELHKSGHVSFPVTEGKKNVVIGVLYLQDLLKVQSGGSVTKYMHSDLQYLHEDFSLYRGLQAIQHSQQRLFMVINDRAEFVGIVTTEDILGQVVGRLAPDEFEAYGNPQAVISSLADKKTSMPEEKADSEATEVV
jgi:CBS domain containing-hemolysin-like protein